MYDKPKGGFIPPREWTQTLPVEPVKGSPKIKITIEADDAEDLMCQLDTIIGTINPPVNAPCHECARVQKHRDAVADLYSAASWARFFASRALGGSPSGGQEP